MNTIKLTKQQHVYAKAYNYILDAIDASGCDKHPKTDKEKLQFVVDTFKSEYGFNIQRMRTQRAFTEWLKGLPSSINIDFENYRIIEIAKDWGSLPKDANDKQEDKILDSWFNFIYMRFEDLCRKYKIAI